MKRSDPDASESPDEPIGGDEPAARGRARHLWNVVAVVVLLAGLSLSSVGALEWQGHVQDQAGDAFSSHASALSAAVSTGIRRDMDFVATQRAGVIAVPDLSNRQLAIWYASIDIKSRFPGGVGFAFVQRVVPSQLGAFGAEVVADPPVNEPVSAPYTVVPSGARPQYCLQRFGIATSASAKIIPPTYDFCSATIPPGSNPSPLPGLLDLATASGQTTVLAAGRIAKTGGIADLFVVMSPVYSGPRTPSSPAARQAGLRGWIVATFSGDAVLRSDAETAQGLKVSVGFNEPDSMPTTVASSGKAPAGAVFTRSVGFAAGGSWVVRVVGSTRSTATVQAVAGGVLGGLASVVLFLFFLLLTRSRSMALQLVDKRTRQLRHLALHDPLTDLPNRALLLDRAEQMLIRAKRHPVVVGALFIDLDKFKEINDTFGHAVGDQLLRAVAARLAGALRATDTVGRLGGDEFVVLVEGNLGGVGPEIVAAQLLSLFAEPFPVDVAGVGPLKIDASMGVAIGPRRGAADLLRDADVALYVAKARGQHGYVVFDSDMHMLFGQHTTTGRTTDSAAATDEQGDPFQGVFDLSDPTTTGVVSSGTASPAEQQERL